MIVSMQSTLIILISVLGWITAESYPQANCTKSVRDRSLEESDETVVLYDKDGDICLTARFSIYVIVDEDGFIEDDFMNDERKRPLELHVQTDNYKGICAGETAFLGSENVTGPAILFAWNETNRENKVLIHWEVKQEETILNDIKINLTDNKNRYLSAKLGNLQLFPTEVGKPVSADAEEIRVHFKDSSTGCLKFRTADYTISVTLRGLSVVTVVVLAVILGVLMALGLMFYHRGSKKKQTNAQPFQP